MRRRGAWLVARKISDGGEAAASRSLVGDEKGLLCYSGMAGKGVDEGERAACFFFFFVDSSFISKFFSPLLLFIEHLFILSLSFFYSYFSHYLSSLLPPSILFLCDRFFFRCVFRNAVVLVFLKYLKFFLVC